jgi:hypothetical protein
MTMKIALDRRVLSEFLVQKISNKTDPELRGGTPSWNSLKFCQFVGASPKGLNIKYLLGWMRSRGDIRFTKFKKVVFSSYFDLSAKSNSYAVPYSYKASQKIWFVKVCSPYSSSPDKKFLF